MSEYEKEEVAGVVEKKSDDDTILDDSREGLKVCIESESSLRSMMLDDLRFSALDQWPSDIRSQRENDIVNGPRPCLTVDQINQYITQVANDMRAQRPSIKPRPVDDVADPDTAKIYAGLFRHIEDQSSAQIAYSTAGDSAVTVGLGFFRIVTEFVSPDSFDQEILIKRVPDTFSVYLAEHKMPDGSDAERGWIFEQVPLERFKREFPKAKVAEQDFAGLGVTPVWKTEDQVTVCEYFYKEYVAKELLYLADGKTVFADQYDGPEANITGKRSTFEVKVHWCKHTGCEVLDKRTLKGKYIPIVEVVGKEKFVEGRRILWGLVRPAKDSLRAFNYWISALTEKMALAPKAPWVGAVGQFQSAGDKWDKANIANYAKLEYDPIDVNGNALPAPRRQEPIQMEPAMAAMLQMMQNNVKSSLGMYKAAIGEAESQQSGKAILALKRESDTGTMHFGENLGISVAYAGRIIVDLIPHYYDTKRVLRIIGEDGQAQTVQIDPEQKESKREIRDSLGKVRRIYNLGVGKYDVTITTGPGYTTSRQEATAVLTELANSAKDPISAAILRYGAIKSADFHGADEMVKMLKATLPPGVQQAEDGDPAQAMAKIMELTQGLQLLQAKAQELAQENQQLRAGTAEAQAKISAEAQEAQARIAADEREAQAKLNAQHQQKMRELQLREAEQNEEARLARARADEESNLAREKAASEVALERWVAEQKISIMRESAKSKPAPMAQ